MGVLTLMGCGCCACTGSGPNSCLLALANGTDLLLQTNNSSKIQLVCCPPDPLNPCNSGGGCTNVGAFGNVCADVKLVWHVECEYNCWQSLAPNVQATGGNAVVRWDDLVGGVNNLTPFHIGGGGQITNYQTGATSTGKPNIQVGSDWRAIFQGAFNFFTAGGKWSYACYYRQASTHIALMDDGVPSTNGLALGYGVGDMDTTGSGSTMLAIRDGGGSTLDSMLLKTIIGVAVVTYDGTGSGSTMIYHIRQGTGMEPPVVVDFSGPYPGLGVTATTGFALGGTYNNADPNRVDTSLSLTEAAIWQGILTLTDVTTIGTQVLNYWGLN